MRNLFEKVEEESVLDSNTGKDEKIKEGNLFKGVDVASLAKIISKEKGATFYTGYNPSIWLTNHGVSAAVSELNYRWENLTGQEIAKRLNEQLEKGGYQEEKHKIAEIAYGAHVSMEQAETWLNGEKIPLVSLCDVCENANIYIENVLGKLDKREAKRTYAVILYNKEFRTYETVAKAESYEEAEKIFNEYPANEDKYDVYLMDANFDRLERLYGKNRIIELK